MIFPHFSAGDDAVSKWYHFAFAAHDLRATLLSEAAVRCMRGYTLAPLVSFLAEYDASRRHQIALARETVPRSRFDDVARQLDVLEWEGYRGTILRRRLEARSIAVDGDVLFRGRFDALVHRLYRFDRLRQLHAPPDLLRNELLLMASCLQDEPSTSGEGGGEDMETFPWLFSRAMSLCCAPDPENHGLADRYGRLLDMDRLLGNPWNSELCFPSPFVPPDPRYDMGFVGRFGINPRAGDDMGPVTVCRGAALVSFGDQLLQTPPDARGCKQRVARFARACRRIGRRGGAMVSFVGKDPTL